MHNNNDETTLWMVPGPCQPPAEANVGACLSRWLGSPDVCAEDFARDLARAERLLRQSFGLSADAEHDEATSTTMVVKSGEAMLGLWAGLKNVVVPGETVVVSGCWGLFSGGLADMAEQVGAARVVRVGSDDMAAACWRRPDLLADELVARIRSERPQLVTAVHCETPCGTLFNELAAVGRACRDVGALLFVDYVSSAFAMPVPVDDWGIDIGVAGSQKVLGLLPDLTVMTLSARARRVIDRRAFVGYEALNDWPARPHAAALYPYTPNWNAVQALAAVLEHHRSRDTDAAAGPFAAVYAAHQRAAAHCRQQAERLGYRLFADSHCPSPTVTAIWLPDDAAVDWPTLAQRLRAEHNIVVGGNYGPLKGKVFRIGHMGLAQADCQAIDRVFAALQHYRN